MKGQQVGYHAVPTMPTLEPPPAINVIKTETLAGDSDTKEQKAKYSDNIPRHEAW